MRQSLFFAIALSVALSSQAVEASAFVPYEKGDIATFKSDRFGNDVNLEIDRESGNWKHYTNFAGFGKLWVWAHPSAERVYIYSSAKGTYQQFADFNGKVGESYTVNLGPCNNGTVVLGAKKQTVVTPAGTFDDCIRLDLRTSCADAGITAIWFKAGLGIVKFSSLNIAGPVNYNLSRANVGGVTYPKPVGSLKVTGSFPGTQAFINLMPTIGPPRPPVKLKVGISVSNTTGADMTFTFGGNQRFEILLIDSNGKVVSRWSRGRAFTKNLVFLTLKNGETWDHSGEIVLTDDNNVPLARGQYTLKIELAALSLGGVGATRLSASAPLSIDHVY